jgi:hypothetical protein
LVVLHRREVQEETEERLLEHLWEQVQWEVSVVLVVLALPHTLRVSSVTTQTRFKTHMRVEQ